MTTGSTNKFSAEKTTPSDDLKDLESAMNQVWKSPYHSPSSPPYLTRVCLTDTSVLYAKQQSALTLTFTPSEHRALLWRQDLTILPLAAAIYFLCYLDRSNIGNARILNSTTHNDMQTEIGATPYQFNVSYSSGRVVHPLL